MKKTFLPILLLSALFVNQSSAQSNKAYAITAETKGNYNWTAIREIDLNNGNVIRTLYSNSNKPKVSYEFINNDWQANRVNIQSMSPTVNGVAAAAFDEKNNRLYFTPMWGTDLRYVDLNTTEMNVVVNGDARFST
ncbi:MAG TPA: hypothetical protein PLH33_07990, partial [Chitinophagaceae bacterium]|nr:hypothetical protein [Chitinophagaceae bacterium]